MKSIIAAVFLVVIALAALVMIRRGDAEDSAPVAGTATEPASTATTAAASTVVTDPIPSGEDAGYQPRFEPARCAFTEPPGHSPDCGYLIVPQDRANPDGPEVRLHVAVFPSVTESPAPDPVVYLEGGPGGEPLETLSLVFEDRFAPFLDDRDLVVFDQRGTGYSEPSLACAPYRDLTFDLLDEALPPEESLAREYEVLSQCRDQFLADGVDLSHYNSAASAADLADLRVALGFDEWNLYGISYGTRLALTALRDHPDGIRSVILDSTYPPEIDGVANIPANADRAFDTFFAGCASDAECSAAYPDLSNRFFQLLDATDRQPITVEVFDVFTGDRYQAVLTGADLLGVVFQSLYDDTLIPTIPQLITQIEQEDYRDLANLVSVFIANGEFVSVGMHASVQCHEEIPFSDPAAAVAAAEAYPYMGRIIEGSITQSPMAGDFCDMWGTRPAAPIENEPVVSDVPTLVLAGEYDPITPPADGEAVAARLTEATFIEFPGLGHAVSAAGDCPLSITLAFLDAPRDSLDTGCITAMMGPDFHVPGEVVEVGALVPFEDATAGVSGVVPDGWQSLGFGAFFRQNSGLDQTALIQQAVPGSSAALVLNLIAGQFGIEDDPAPIGELQSGGRAWTRYEGEIQGFVADIALAESDGRTYLVVLISDPEERADLVDGVLVPAMEAIDAA